MTWRWYWFSFRRGLPVTFHLGTDRRVLWHRIYGVQIGTTFIGVVHSSDEAGTR